MAYRILSLDGGGAWALIEVKALIQMFGANTIGHAVLSNFDLAAANSGGSIVLGGLLENLPLSQILDYFQNETLRRSIFQPTGKLLDAELNRLLHVGPRYSAKKKLPALQRLMPNTGNKKLPDVVSGLKGAGGDDLRVLITGFDFDRNVAAFFRSGSSGGPSWGSSGASTDVTLAEAIHASSNAPVNFFDEPALAGGNRFWDGAIAACNNPVLAAVTEAITLDTAPADIRALSIGTGTVRYPGPPIDNPPPFITPRAVQSLPQDLAKLAGSITDDPPDVATFIAHVVTGGKVGLPASAFGRVVRLNPMVSPFSDNQGGWVPPEGWTKEQLDHLADIDLAALEPIDINYIASFADAWIADKFKNEPLRMSSDTLASKLGPLKFSEALSAWEAIKSGAQTAPKRGKTKV